MYELVIALGGTISAEHGVGVEKLSYLEGLVESNAIDKMREIKQVFDPKNILNPNKIFNI